MTTKNMEKKIIITEQSANALRILDYLKAKRLENKKLLDEKLDQIWKRKEL